MVNYTKAAPKHVRLYVLKSTIKDIQNKTKHKFDLYIAKNGTRIKGAVEIIPTAQFTLNTPNGEKIRFNINPKYYEDVFGGKLIEQTKHTVIRTYVKEDYGIIENLSEVFKGDVDWIKNIDYRYIDELMKKSFGFFMMYELNSLNLELHNKYEITTSINSYSNMEWMSEYRIDVNVSSYLLAEMMRGSPRLFNKKLDYMYSHIPKQYFNNIEI